MLHLDFKEYGVDKVEKIGETEKKRQCNYTEGAETENIDVERCLCVCTTHYQTYISILLRTENNKIAKLEIGANLTARKNIQNNE